MSVLMLFWVSLTFWFRAVYLPLLVDVCLELCSRVKRVACFKIIYLNLNYFPRITFISTFCFVVYSLSKWQTQINHMMWPSSKAQPVFTVFKPRILKDKQTEISDHWNHEHMVCNIRESGCGQGSTNQGSLNHSASGLLSFSIILSVSK